MVAPGKVVGQIGNQLWTTFFLFDNAIANPDSALITEFERMLDTDETVAAGVEFMILSVINKLDRYENESNPKIQDFVNEALETMDIMQTCTDVLSALWAGYSGTEIVWKVSGGLIVPDYTATYHPRTVYFNIDKLTGRLDQQNPIKQWRWFDGSPVDIPKNKCIVYTHNGRFGQPYGVSQLKRARKNWLLKDPMLKMWVNALDKFGTPLVAALVPDGDVRDPEQPFNSDGTENLITNIELTARYLADLQSGTGLAMASGTAEQKSDIKSLAAGGTGMGDAFDNAVSYLNKMIFRSLLVPSLIFDEGQRTGSYALGQSHFDIYSMMLARIYKQLTEALVQQLVKPMIEYNFGPQKDYGSFPEREISEDDKSKLAAVFQQMIGAGVLDTSAKEHLEYMWTTLGFPVLNYDQMMQRKQEQAQQYSSYLNDPDDDDPAAKADPTEEKEH